MVYPLYCFTCIEHTVGCGLSVLIFFVSFIAISLYQVMPTCIVFNTL